MLQYTPEFKFQQEQVMKLEARAAVARTQLQKMCQHITPDGVAAKSSAAPHYGVCTICGGY